MNKKLSIVWTLALALGLFGCGGGDGGDGGGDGQGPSTGTDGGTDTGGGQEKGGETKVDPAKTGTLKGKIVFKGQHVASPVNIGVPDCAKMHSDDLLKEEIVLGENDELKNVLVYVKSGLEKYKFDVDGDVELDQKGCQYLPHVVAVVRNQTLVIRNSDDLLHNINYEGAKKNKGESIGQKLGDKKPIQFKNPELKIPVKCNVHDWMGAWIHVLKNPKFAVSAADGTFEISGIPEGDYEIEALHESLGSQTAKVSIKSKATAAQDFTFEKK